MSNDEVLAAYARKVDEGVAGTIFIMEVAASVRVALEASTDLAAAVRALIGTGFRENGMRGREEDLQMATAVILQRAATGGSLPLYIWSSAHWYKLPDSYFTSKVMLDGTEGRAEDARPVAVGSWMNGEAHRSDFSENDDRKHLSVVDLRYPVQTTLAGQSSALTAARGLADPASVPILEDRSDAPTSLDGWKVRPGERQKAWVHRTDVLAEATRRMGEAITLAAQNDALAGMASECGYQWTAGGISATRRKIKS